MNHTLHFAKMSGAGNDFVVIDDRHHALPADAASLARALCDRHRGVGADGLLLVRTGVRAEFLMEYYNADGSSGGMCGNGGRCIARFAALEGIAGPSRMRFEALGHVYEAVLTGEIVRLAMRDPTVLSRGITIHDAGPRLEADFIDTGAPHAVVFVPAVASVDVTALGRAIRNDVAFAPGGTNVNFAGRSDDGGLDLRTYERGVEAETLACGTGSIAAAVDAAMRFGLTSPLAVHVRSGETLCVHFTRTGETSFEQIILEGSARIVFRGVCNVNATAGTLNELPASFRGQEGPSPA